MNIFRFYVWNPETGILPKSEPEARNYVQAREAARDWPPMDDKLRGFIRDVEQKAPLQEDLFDVVTLGELETLSKTTDNNQRGGCVIVDFPMDASLPEMDFVVRLGVNAGLAVYFETGGILFLSGWAQPAERAASWTYEVIRQRYDKPEFPLNLRDFKKMVEPKVVALLEEHGFVYSSSNKLSGTKYYLRPFEGGEQILNIGYIFDRRLGGFGMFPSLKVNYQACEDILNGYKFVCPDAVIYVSIRAFLELDDINWTVKSLEDLEFVMSKISGPFLGMADKILTLKGLDEVLNGDGDTKVRDEVVKNRARQPHALVIAKLAGNPNFEQLAVDLKNTGDLLGNAPIMDEEWPKLVDYLRNHVKPLV